MKLHIVDILIICAYLMVIVAIGLFLKKKFTSMMMKIMVSTKMSKYTGLIYTGKMNENSENTM